MKMETNIIAKKLGIIQEIAVEEKQSVKTGQLLIVIEE